MSLSSLKQVGLATAMYADDNNETFYFYRNGGDLEIPNNGQWFPNPSSTVPLSPNPSQNISDAATVLEEIKPKIRREQVAEGRKRAQQFSPGGASTNAAQ